MKPNIVEFKVYGDYALFSDPITRVGGEKLSYQVPTYEALKGIVESIYWKPTIVWIIDEVKIINPIQTESKGIRIIRYDNNSLCDRAFYTYLKNVEYDVRAHFIWNENRPDLEKDRNENKHYIMSKRFIERGGRRDIFLGTRECQAYVEPCNFDKDKSFYKDINEINFGNMFHGITYPDEAFLGSDKSYMTLRFWNCKMKNGIIKFTNPNNILEKDKRHIREMNIKKFGYNKNFKGIEEFKM